MPADFAAARQYAHDRLSRELTPTLSYHNLAHTFDDVLPNSLRLGELAGISEADRLLLATAAAFHDIGYPTRADGHEEIGARISAEMLPTFGYTPDQIDAIVGMIRATRIPQTATTLLEQLLCDADLDILGRPDDFLQRNHALRDEIQATGRTIPLRQWYEGQRNFVSSHRYHSDAARQTRSAGKQAVLALLDQRLLTLRLATFIPSDLRRSLQRHAPSATGYTTDGAALFADIAGFTALTEKLIGQYGAERGAEAVLQAINPLYDAIIPVLHQFNGSVVRFDGDAVNCVIGFAGDSITCWLDGPDATERAVACALAMQQAMAGQIVQFEDGSSQQMQLKIGIASGPVRRMQVGDPTLGLYDVLAGQTVVRMAVAAELARPSDIILDPPTSARLDTQVNTVPVTDGYGKLLRFQQVVEQVRSEVNSAEIIPTSTAKQWVLPPVAERLAAGGFLAELRPAAALFMRFHGLDYDADPDVGSKLDRFIRWVQQVLTQTRGYLIQLSIGDKGSYLYAAFGAPRAFTDNAARAASAALILRGAEQHFSFITQVELGLTQGRMWTGAYGSNDRNTYGVISRATNLAARLMTAAAPNQILVHSSAASELGTFQLDPQSSILAKGFNGPQPILSLIGAKHSSDQLPSYRQPLIGRDGALTMLAATWQTAHSGQGQATALLGEAGIGKTHLAATFAQDTRLLASRVIWAQADQTRRDRLYDVWRQAFRDLLGLTRSQSDELTPSQLLAWLQNNLPTDPLRNDERLPLLGDLLDIALPENEVTAEFEPSVRRESLFALLLSLLEAYTTEPVLLVIDDAHLLDEGSQALLLRVLQAMRNWPLHLLLLRRPPEGDVAAWQAVREQTLLQIHNVQPLSQETIGTLVTTQLGKPPSPLLASLLERQTHGNPFYLESLAETLRDDTQIVLAEDEMMWQLSPHLLERLRQADCLDLSDGQWQLDPAADLAAVRLGLPDSVHRSVLTRIDRLPEQTKLVLKLASVIGQQFAPALLLAAHPQRISAENLSPELEQLVDRSLIRPIGNGHYQFRHHATQEVTYDTLLFTQQQQLHQLVHDALHASNPNNHAALARHAFAAQAWQDALPHLQALCTAAQRLYANHQTVAHSERVLTCLDKLKQPDGRESVHLALGESLIHLGRYDEARDNLVRARDLAEMAGLPQLVARACRWMARAFELQGDYPTAMEWLDRGRDADQNESRESAELYLLSGLIESHRGNYEASQELCDSAIVMAQHFDTPAILGRAYNLAGILALYRGQRELALQQFGQALETYRGCSNRRGEALALNQLANALSDRGDLREANDRYQQARAIFVETGDTYNRLLVDNNIGNIAQQQRRPGDALRHYDAALESLEQLGGAAYAKGALLLNHGVTQILRGDLNAAAADLQESKRVLESANVRVLMPELMRAEAQVALLRGDLATATQRAEASLALARELDMRSEEGHTLRVRGQIALSAENYTSAESMLLESLQIMEESADLFGSAETEQQLAALYTQLGDQAKAATYHEQAMARYQQLGVRT